MINIYVNILNGITNRLDEIFPDIPIHINPSTQGFKEPCFLIYKVDRPQTREPMERYWYSAIYNVVYLAGKNGDLFKTDEIEERLLLELEYIYLGNRPLRGTINSTIVDGDLSVTAEYTYSLRKIVNPDIDYVDPSENGEGGNPIDPDDDNKDKPIQPNPDPDRPTDPDIEGDIDFMRILDHKHEKRGRNG